MSRKILIVTASKAQLPLINRAKELGLFVVATDSDANAPGLKAADVAEVINTLDPEAVLAVARRHAVDAVVTEQTDVAVPTVALVAERMGLRGIGVEVARKASHKYDMRRACAAAGVPTPKFVSCRTLDDARRAADEIEYPVIVKPVDNQSSKGVTKVKTPAELEAAVNEALRNTRSGEFLVEELMLGTEAAVDAFVDGDTVTTLGICDKTKCPPPYSFDMRLIFPGRFDAAILDELRRANEAVLRAVGIRMGITHGEYIVTPRGVRLIEIAARGCGARVATDLLPAMTGADLLGARLRQALGEPPGLEVTRTLAGVLDFIVLPPGRALRVGPADEARAVPGVVGVEISVREGQEWNVIKSGDARHGYVLAVGETSAVALEAATTARGNGVVRRGGAGVRAPGLRSGLLDSLTHVTPDGRWFNSDRDASEERLLREMDDVGVERAVVVALAGYISNDFVFDVCRRRADRLIPGGSFNPAAYADPKQAAAAVRAELGSSQVKIIKLHPRLGKYDPLDPRCSAVLEEIATWTDPPLIWFCTLFYTAGVPTQKPMVATIRDIVVRFPTLTFVLLHGGGPSILELAEAVRGCENAIVDISFTLYRYADSSVWLDLKYLARNFDRRTIYGSDFPERGLRESYAHLERLTMDIEADAKARLGGGNLARLLASKGLS
jgi:biotin carboxylase/predicted TIM-barrel fold metal-dependent hydrolase